MAARGEERERDARGERVGGGGGREKMIFATVATSFKPSLKPKLLQLSP